MLTPFLLFIICLEAFLSMRNNLHDYKIKDTLANISVGLMSLGTGLLLKGFSILILIKVQGHSLFHFGTSVFVCVLLFLLSDLFHYCFHYLEHKSRFLWATHSIHHSSESFNFSTGIRTPIINSFYRLLYEAPLCILGFDARMVVLVHTMHAYLWVLSAY
jgi:sterol desaturase/sphingolipid hydroxylase (fatty acid hydroxylase superfamily)